MSNVVVALQMCVFTFYWNFITFIKYINKINAHHKHTHKFPMLFFVSRNFA